MEHRLQGWLDSPLTKEGVEDALKLQDRLKDIHIDYCYSSPIGRAKQTTELLFNNVPIIFDDRLKEMNFGDFEGLYVDDLLNEASYYKLWNEPTSTLSLPNGETFEDVRNRLICFLQDAYKKHSDKTIFITGHGMLIILFRSIIEGYPIDKLAQINEVFRGCSLSEVEFDGTNFLIHYLNNSDHLSKDVNQRNYAK